ncbi:MAG: hypothetical protein ACKOSQ_02410 [Planctomycetaceae bacterium]
MRLTLRTLLSWKDGMLGAEATRDLAGKVGGSDAARRLVERIDEVVARPTLGASAPDATGFAASANTTAEYLDNALAPDRLGEFERACFASDVQLAETAASHEILAVWSREPAAPLDAAARRRLLAAVRARATGDPGAGERHAAAPRPAVAAPPAARPARAPATAWLLVAAALALLVALVGVLGWSLARTGGKPAGGRDVAARPAEARAPDVAPPVADAAPADAPLPADPPRDEPPATAVVTAPPTAEPVETAVPTPAEPRAAENAAAATPPAGDRPPPPAVAADTGGGEVPAFVADAPPDTVPPPAPVAPPAGPGDRRVPQGDALAIAAPADFAPPVPAPAANAPGAPPIAAPQNAPVAVVGPAVLLHRPAGAGAEAWLAGADGTPLELPVDLLAPPFGRPGLVVDGTRIALEPGTRAVVGRDADGTPRLEIVFGAAVAAGGQRLGVTAGGLGGVIAAGLGAPVGVEVRLTRRPGDGPESANRVARILPTTSPLEWRPSAGAVVAPIPPGQALVWRSDRPDAALPEAVGSPPEWLAGRRGDDPIDAHAARALASRLAAGTAALPALRDLAADRRSERRLAAAATLALVGEFDPAARLVCAAGPDKLPEAQWERLDAVAVQPALARGPKAAEALAAAFDVQAPPGAAETVKRLARGLTDDEFAAGGDADLVAALESPHLAVRRYAIAILVDVVRPSAVERLKYRADRSAEGLREGVAWWRARLEEGRIRRAP